MEDNRRNLKLRVMEKTEKDMPRRCAQAFSVLVSEGGGLSRKTFYAISAFATVVVLAGILFAVPRPAYISPETVTDDIVRRELIDACLKAMKHSIQNPLELITVKKLSETGYAPNKMVEITVLDGRWDNLNIRARHVEGEKTFIADKFCCVIEKKE